jgi:hypothetical protein
VTASRVDTDNEQVLLVWMGVGPSGQECPLMVLCEDPHHGVAFRPLFSLSAEASAQHRAAAVEAAGALGVEAVLREFRAWSVLDRVGGA